MSDLVYRFSVSYNLDKTNKKKQNENNDSSAKLQVAECYTTFNRTHITEGVVKHLLQFGYELEQIMAAFKIYKFGSVEEALFILMKDQDTFKFNHQFVPEENDNQEGFKAITGLCLLCREKRSDHVDYDFEEMKNLDVGMKRRKEEEEDIKDNSLNDKSNMPMGKSTEVSGIAEHKLNSDRKIMTVQNVNIPKETLDLFNNPEVCRICFSEVLDEKTKAQFACGHSFCKTCVSNFLNMNIVNGKVRKIKLISS